MIPNYIRNYGEITLYVRGRVALACVVTILHTYDMEHFGSLILIACC